MSRFSNKCKAGCLLAAMGLASLLPTTPVAWIIPVSVLASWSDTAVARNSVAGTEVVIRKSDDNQRIIAPADKDGVVRIKGLEHGDYAVKLLGDHPDVTMAVGRSGNLALAIKSADGQLEQLSYDRSATYDGVLTVKPRGLIDVSKSSADVMLNNTNNSNAAAAIIIAERRNNGPYQDPQDFARRVCSQVGLDFDFSHTRIGDTMIVPRAADPALTGFKCERGGDSFEVHGKKYPNAGAAKLL